ncbi:MULTISPECIES: type I glutamate--ammonia ligase [Glutamicibacter]|jgi:glutamine synthetase|uniref:Glutamine synthetase n=2 Tax=Glutamicibacter arilaitensis TaxID=256701 RepID=A0A2N7S377_9MICC|nr:MULTISPECIES: type I glutamate--ammonia ligase [Glutamicibacter]PMQ20590.1 type I glutamate--ammonia ligase [Glutamicibacter arilaitensis]TFH56819.1 type I glutamate--ammonia ligase [Glutamicibacter arilaitensis]CBT76278.1 glutamate--ammonia ligase, type I [Glutamicibacter arilaitensis Re117]HCH48286.1 type I glutamate--ammonia ligase [Glutamicibacter sp.]HCM94409.1 type I glutamate--ammonia ligase [Glutamicibacter sp.]
MDRQQEFVLRTIEERDVRFVRMWFTDVVGSLKSVALAPAEVEDAFEEGLGFDGSSIDGLSRISESDMLLQPDPSTFQILPWRGEVEPTSRMFCDILTPEGQPSNADPRQVLKRQLTEASNMGFTCYTHPEIEFYLLQNDQLDANGRPQPIDNGGYFDHVPDGVGQDFRRASVTTLEALGISVEFSHHETGPGQNEIDLRYADALQTADNIMTFRTVIKEMAMQKGIHATFMPKPFSDQPGSGMHTHFSLFEGDANAFFEAGREYQLSDVARSFIAGILHHAPEMTAITNQYVNSYKRLWGGGEAPSHRSWGHNNRSALVRVPLYKPGKGQSARVEYRGIDSAANPYLAYAVLLGAGLKGIREGYELEEPTEDDVWSLSTAERRASGHVPLPGSLHDALRAMEESELMAEILGEQVFNSFLSNKRTEWEEYRQVITPYELNKYLGIL